MKIQKKFYIFSMQSNYSIMFNFIQFYDIRFLFYEQYFLFSVYVRFIRSISPTFYIA